MIKVGDWGHGDIWRVVSGEFPSNAYICEIKNELTAVIIDGGLDPVFIDSCLDKLKLTPKAVLCTHGHFDHAGSSAYFEEKYKSPIYISKYDKKTLNTSNFLLMVLGIKSRIKMPKNVHWVIDGYVVKVNDLVAKFHDFAGHTPGSSLIEIGNAIFTGDSIYARGMGLSGLPGEDTELLKRNVKKRWKDYLTCEKYVLYPGHGEHICARDLIHNNNELVNFISN